MKPYRWILVILSLSLLAVRLAGSTLIVDAGRANAVIVIPDQRYAASAQELQSYIAKASGARLEIVSEEQPDSWPDVVNRVYVGPVKLARGVVDVAGLEPEGFVIKVDGPEVFIVGRDTTDAGMKVDGTYYGVGEFLEQFLGVRWLMPGPLGEVIPSKPTLQLEDGEIRQESQQWQRRIRDSKLDSHAVKIREMLMDWGVSIEAWEAAFPKETTVPWFRHQRIGERVEMKYRHAFHGWWDKYHEQYPEIFALQPDGTRISEGERERLCVSNPVLWDLVAEEKIAELRANPTLTAASISPNDGGRDRFCSCERCRSWDSPEAKEMYRVNPQRNPGPGSEGPFPPLADRYFRFYNEVARRVKAVLPDRYLACYAYSVYKSPPVLIDRLEDNLIVGYVGFNSYVREEERLADRAEWVAWSKLAKQLFLRPNVLYQPVGLPVNYVHKLGEDFRLMADNGMRATDFDGGVGNWGTQGLVYYVLAKLTWDPYLDVDALVEDYCHAAYGPGAAAMLDYYQRLEALTDRLALASPQVAAKKGTDIYAIADYYTDPVLSDLRGCTDRAKAAIGISDAAATQRVELVVTGLEFAAKTRDLLAAAESVRAGRSTRAAFKTIHEDTMSYYKSLIFSWAVAVDHNYSFMRRGLSLTSAGRDRILDAGDE